MNRSTRRRPRGLLPRNDLNRTKHTWQVQAGDNRAGAPYTALLGR